MKSIARLTSLILLVTIIVCGKPVFADSSAAKILDWHPENLPVKKGQPCNLCNGHYSEPASISAVPHPPNYKTVSVIITAKGPIIFRTDGASVLQQNVEIRQPGRLIQADKAIVYRDKKTGKIANIKLSGHVRIREAGKLLAGEKADYDLSNNIVRINNSAYHIAGKHELTTVSMPFDVWGTATELRRLPDKAIELQHASYSTCPPVDPAWMITASQIRLDEAKGNGSAENVVLHFKNIPIFYTPYYSFPLNAERKSGLLVPAFGYTTNHGFYVSQPFYWNIAPNYDLLLTPEWYAQRGAQLNSLFRYLTPYADGMWYASFLPDDQEFAQYKQTTLSKASTATPAPYLNVLRDQNNDRGFIDLQNNIHFNQEWHAKLYAQYATDPYFSEDFQSLFLQQNSDQLPSFAELDYSGLHWNDVFLIQSYQTLHPIDQILTPAQNQYTRLPELDFNAAYPQFLDHYDFNLSAQAVRFVYDSAYYPLTNERPIGNRIHLQPGISRPFEWASGYITPTLTLDSTSYFSQSATTALGLPRNDFDINRTLPIVDIDTGFYFDRFVHFGEKDYVQTIEPRFFYLYVPYLNQDEYPNFDTQLLPFSAMNLYTLNAFTGYDRLQNANQVSIGLSTHFMNAVSSDDVLSAEAGFIDYFEDQKVCLLQNCTRTAQSISPITGELTWHPGKEWDVTGQAAWDNTLKQVNNAQLGTKYHFNHESIAILNYEFAHGNPDTPFDSLGFSTNSSLITAGVVWPLIQRWHFFGYNYYDLTHQHPVNQYVGLSYNTCCWALRFIVSHAYTGTLQLTNGELQNQYNTTYFIQLLLKGLGSSGNRNAASMLTTTLPGFQDNFSNHGRYGFSQNL